MSTVIGKVTHCFVPIGVVAVKIPSSAGQGVKKGDRVKFFKSTGKGKLDYEHTQKITSMEINGDIVTSAEPGTEVAIKIVNGSLPPNNAEMQLAS